MKTMAIFIACWLISIPTLIAQKNKEQLEDISHHERIIEIPGKNKNEIYLSVLKWAANYYKSATKVIDHKDQESGEVVIKAIGSVMAYKSFGSIKYCDTKYDLQISIKDGKIRLIMDYSTMIFEAVGNSPRRDIDINIQYKDSWPKNRPLLKSGAFDHFDIVCRSIEKSINTSSNDAW
jgi:hypothetical protein